MKYSDALKMIELKKDIIGSTSSNGLLIDLIIIVPVVKNQRDVFIKNMLFSHDLKQAILPFIDSEVEVWATNADYLYKQNILFYDLIREEQYP